MKGVILLLLATAILTSCQQYLPKEPGFLPMSDLYTRDTARSGLNSFWKVDQAEFSLLISSLPVRPNAITKVTIYLEDGATSHLGVGMKKDPQTLEGGDICRMSGIVSYWSPTGNKCKWIANGGRAEQTVYGTPAFEGDNITMTIDMRAYQGSVSFAKNGLPMGIAYAGLHEWGDIYIYITLYYPNNRIKIIDYQVI
jgi:hypothetical protein